jgi:EAL domain-containing protein (putative c-di-GMP-specific phosphodiesterase class I)/ActR/RegA family two-component response regulator
MDPHDAAPTPIRVVIADDEPVVAEYLQLVLGFEGADFDVLATAADAGSAVEAVRRHEPDVLLLDLAMPGGGVQAAQLVGSVSPSTRVLVFTADADGDDLLALVRSGISGYLTKTATSAEVVDAVRLVAAGGTDFVPGIAARAVGELATRLHDERNGAARAERARQRVERVIRSQGFTIVCQPVVGLSSRRPVGVETLTRFAGTPHRPPDAWFAEAEAVNRRIDLEVATARAALALVDEIADGLWLSVNLSPATLLSGAVGPLLDAVDLSRVVVELTEHAAVDDYGFLNAALDRWRNRGLRVAVDDAGSGYASFAHVLKAQPEFIKLDETLTSDIDTDARKQALGRAVCQFAGSIGVELIAEGVETTAQLDALRAAGATLGQGYLLGRPTRLDHLGGRYRRALDARPPAGVESRS